MASNDSLLGAFVGAAISCVTFRLRWLRTMKVQARTVASIGTDNRG